MRLPEAAEKLFHDEMNTFEEERKMRYINMVNGLFFSVFHC